MKLAFVCDLPKEHFSYWNDGLRAALDYLVKKYNWQVSIFNLSSGQKTLDPDEYDFGLFWGAFGNKQHNRKYFKKQGLCFAGGPVSHPNLRNFDVVFTESSVDNEAIKQQGVLTVKAFGTNIKLFRPLPDQKKVWDYIFPAAFALWKRHYVFAQTVEERKALGLAVGYMQPNGWEKETYEYCLSHGITVLPWVPVDALVWLYNASKICLVTADANGGSQRVILEAKACGLDVEVISESPKLLELKDLTPEQVRNDWSEVSYGESLYNAISAVVEGAIIV